MFVAFVVEFVSVVFVEFVDEVILINSFLTTVKSVKDFGRSKANLSGFNTYPSSFFSATLLSE